MNYLTNLAKVFIMLLISSTMMIAQGKEQKPYAPSDTLHEYISLNCKKKCVDSERLLSATRKAAREYGIDFKKLLAIVRVESSFKINAKNGNSVGLAQVNLRYHSRLFQESPFNPEDNINAGARIYKACQVKHSKRADTERRALRCYNGEGSKNFIYADKVLKAYKEISAISEIVSRYKLIP